MFYASASSNVWRYFSGRSYVCCHHLDPGVFSSLPPKVAIQQWKYYMQTFLKWLQETFVFFSSETWFFIRESFAFFSEPFISSSAAPPSPQLTMSPSVLTASLGEHSFVRKMCQVSIIVWCVLIGLFLDVSNYVQKLVPSAKHRRPSKSRLWPIDQEICIWYQHSAIHLTAVNMKC